MSLKSKIAEKIDRHIEERLLPVREELSGLKEEINRLQERLNDYEKVKENIRNINALIESYGENIRANNAREEEIARRLEGYESIKLNVKNLNTSFENYGKNLRSNNETIKSFSVRLSDYEKIKENIRNLNSSFEKFGENLRNNNTNIQSLNSRLEDYERIKENIRNLNTTFERYGENIRANNSRLDELKLSLDMSKAKLNLLQRKTEDLEKTRAGVVQERCDNFEEIPADKTEAAVQKEFSGNTEKIAAVKQVSGDVYTGIDYFDFENHFRGPVELIKRRQEPYVEYFKGRNNVLDLGCGRGEFLTLLKEKGIDAQGVDLYEEFVEFCKMSGLKASRGDGIEFLRAQERVGGIFAGQLIEHLSTAQIVELCNLAFEKLEDGACIIMETPNPKCLSIYANAFYLDPSHQKPVHPEFMRYVLQKAGFKDIKVLYTELSRVGSPIPEADVGKNSDEFNEKMRRVSESIFGSQDYAIVGIKQSYSSVDGA